MDIDGPSPWYSSMNTDLPIQNSSSQYKDGPRLDTKAAIYTNLSEKKAFVSFNVNQ